ncbi:SH3 domain-containing protein [Streptomyces finlayi]|uniref:SH3 domain-containing protein n=1 Tax=Streptomyces finlayi TaxID=67296 RepID=A0A7G7BHY8_9ACTN|nr:SH3 domain-containing protein [Streptomyces finlayi]QNE74953.1 SH3 domain-containing protein [Streptomyces finlayi]
MSAQPRPGFRRMALCVATGVLAAVTVAAPAFAAGPAEPPPAPPAEAAAPVAEQAEAAAAAADHADYLGRVTARTGLLLRDRPTRSSRIVGQVPYNAVVHIFCKTTGDNVDGNNRWYLLTDGTWAWGSARYIANIGTAPRWC